MMCPFSEPKQIMSLSLPFCESSDGHEVKFRSKTFAGSLNVSSCLGRLKRKRKPFCLSPSFLLGTRRSEDTLCRAAAPSGGQNGQDKGTALVPDRHPAAEHPSHHLLSHVFLSGILWVMCFEQF